MRTYQHQPSGTVDRARELRRSASPIERALLRDLRATFPHRKWRHQLPLGPFFADICCHSERLVIEVDGDSHAETAAYDAARTAYIEREGYRLLRFTNRDVAGDRVGVLAVIATHLATPSPPGADAPSPLTRWERGGAAKPRRGEGDIHGKEGGAA